MEFLFFLIKIAFFLLQNDVAINFLYPIVWVGSISRRFVVLQKTNSNNKRRWTGGKKSYQLQLEGWQ